MWGSEVTKIVISKEFANVQWSKVYSKSKWIQGIFGNAHPYCIMWLHCSLGSDHKTCTLCIVHGTVLLPTNTTRNMHSQIQDDCTVLLIALLLLYRNIMVSLQKTNTKYFPLAFQCKRWTNMCLGCIAQECLILKLLFGMLSPIETSIQLIFAWNYTRIYKLQNALNIFLHLVLCIYTKWFSDVAL